MSKHNIKNLILPLVLFTVASGCACHWNMEKKCNTCDCPAPQAIQPSTPIPAPVVVEPKVEEPKKGALLGSLKGSTFKHNSDELTPSGQRILDKNAQMMEKFPNIKVEIAGHTSMSGSKELNQKLSERRAESVKSYLVNKGIASERLSTVGYGSSKPAVKETYPYRPRTKEALQNRRIELRVVEQ